MGVEEESLGNLNNNGKGKPLDGRVTWEGCSVLLDINDGDRLVFARLSPNATVKIGNAKLSLSPLVGCSFGSLFQVESSHKGPYLARCHFATTNATQDSSVREKVKGQSKDECLKDNRALVDNNSAQGLSCEDIDAMRREGATGDEIIEALISNSSTFEKKTAFSQEKYRIKKQKKYAPKILLRRPFTRSISEAYFKKYPTRIGYLRLDALSLLLSAANVSCFSDILVVDKVGGILVGAVAERLGSTGKVCCTYFGVMPYPSNIVKLFNFDADLCSRILQAPFSILSSSHGEGNGHFESHINPQSVEIPTKSEEVPSLMETVISGNLIPSPKEQSHTDNDCQDWQLACNNNDPPCSDDDGVQDRTSSSLTIRKSSNPGRLALPETIKLWKERGFTSLIVAAPDLDTEIIVQELLPLLAYSAPFAIYHQYLQPLTTCMNKLQTAKMAISLQISEPWLREYQVLPSRTHPHMQMSGFGGYILSGIRTCPSEAC